MKAGAFTAPRKCLRQILHWRGNLVLSKEASLPEKKGITRFINKANKIGEIETAFALLKACSDILKSAKRLRFCPSLSRAELEAKEIFILEDARKRLVAKKPFNPSFAPLVCNDVLFSYILRLDKANRQEQKHPLLSMEYSASL